MEAAAGVINISLHSSSRAGGELILGDMLSFYLKLNLTGTSSSSAPSPPPSVTTTTISDYHHYYYHPHNTTTANNTNITTEPQHAQSQARPFTGTLVAEYVVRVTLAALMVGVNALVMVTLTSTPWLRCAANSWVIGSLAVTDLLVGVVSPAGLLIELQVLTHPVLCRLGYASVMALTSVSINHLLFLSVDRYLLISRPLRYRRMVTRRRVWLFISACWLWAWSLSLPFALGLTVQQSWDGRCCRAEHMIPPWLISLLALLHFVMPLLVMLYVHVAIFAVARRHQRAVKNSLRAGSSSTMMFSSISATTTNTTNSATNATFCSTNATTTTTTNTSTTTTTTTGMMNNNGVERKNSLCDDDGEEKKKDRGSGDGGGGGGFVVGGEGRMKVGGSSISSKHTLLSKLKNEAGFRSLSLPTLTDATSPRAGSTRSLNAITTTSTSRHHPSPLCASTTTSFSSSQAKLRAARLLVLPCGYFYISWAPWFIVMLWAVFSGSTVEPHVLERFVQTLAILNSLGNPVLYAVSQPLLGRAMLRKVKSLFARIRCWCRGGGGGDGGRGNGGSSDSGGGGGGGGSDKEWSCCSCWCCCRNSSMEQQVWESTTLVCPDKCESVTVV